MRITFSFDDNHKLNLRVADMFDEFGFKATFYINKNVTPEHPQSMEADEIKNLFDRGFEIGAHTLTHPVLTTIESEEELWNEIKGSKDYLEELTGAKVYGFCYPKGSFNDEVINCVQLAGCRYGRTVGEGCTANPDNPYIIVPTIQIYNKARRRCLRFKKRLINKEPYSMSGDWKKSCSSFMRKLKEEEPLKSERIIHIWGHSWEVDQQNLWKDLENLLDWINNFNLTPVSNYEAYKTQ